MKEIKIQSANFPDQVLALLPRLRRFAGGLVHDAADRDDLCQATVLRALERCDQWQAGTRLDSWMYKMMRNIWIDEQRTRMRRGEVLMSEDNGALSSIGGGQEDVVHVDDVDRALRQLPFEQREAVLLVAVEGYSYKEAAAIIGCPVGTLNSRLVRGREALLVQLGEAR